MCGWCRASVHLFCFFSENCLMCLFVIKHHLQYKCDISLLPNTLFSPSKKAIIFKVTLKFVQAYYIKEILLFQNLAITSKHLRRPIRQHLPSQCLYFLHSLPPIFVIFVLYCSTHTHILTMIYQVSFIKKVC